MVKINYVTGQESIIEYGIPQGNVTTCSYSVYIRYHLCITNLVSELNFDGLVVSILMIPIYFSLKNHGKGFIIKPLFVGTKFINAYVTEI